VSCRASGRARECPPKATPIRFPSAFATIRRIVRAFGASARALGVAATEPFAGARWDRLLRAGRRGQRREPGIGRFRQARKVPLPSALERRALISVNMTNDRYQPIDGTPRDAQHGVAALRAVALHVSGAIGHRNLSTAGRRARFHVSPGLHGMSKRRTHDTRPRYVDVRRIHARFEHVTPCYARAWRRVAR